MHKNIAVAELTIDEAVAAIVKVGYVYNSEHIPVGVPIKDGRPDRKSVHDWWIGRSIPASRSGLREALEVLHISSPQFLLTKCFGLSLSDQYWVKPAGKAIDWKDINFFDNKFSEDVGNALFGRTPDGGDINLMSPDNTSDGWLKKKWVSDGGKRLLLKGGSGPYYQEPLNEVIASAVMRRLAISHVTYSLVWDGDQPFSACEDFITPNTELVSAWHIHMTSKKPGHVSEYRHFIGGCKFLGIPEAQESIDRMLTVDFIIANSDRHFGNFGAIRNAETLEWIGFAPIFDCGTSMWHDQVHNMIKPKAEQDSKPFRSKHMEQIKLVEDFDWLDFSALKGIDEEYSEILKQSPYIDGQRRVALCNALSVRINMMERMVMEMRPVQGMGMRMD